MKQVLKQIAYRLPMVRQVLLELDTLRKNQASLLRERDELSREREKLFSRLNSGNGTEAKYLPDADELKIYF
ncbi:hypothetical protein [Thalassospira profundimaris]|uniref:Uncharacterized protein n=1 Tax=Thalassospira profundimaris TaxID=502049 RepID=A0A367WHS4_9PROT|nr:hypothetical protein [Thalassospira profundimaris]RCK40978.1 hypothetical protein TH30_22425 [Thalassospira profundimaris]